MAGPAACFLTAEQFLEDRRLSEARIEFERLATTGAERDRCSAGLWMVSMLQGDFEAAWKQSDAIRLRGASDAHRFWNGEDIRGARVMVRSLHGFGDTVQMLRYAPLLRTQASQVLFEVPPRFVELARTFSGVDNVVTWGTDASVEAPAWDVQVEMMELPYLFRTTLTELPLWTGYIRCPQAAVQHCSIAMTRSRGRSRRSRIGLVWAGGDWNPQRSIPFHFLAPLLRNKDFEFWNLQGGGAAQDAAGTDMRDATAECGDGLLSLAATIENLDLVITVDTLAAHLAGAIGKPAWVMLQHAADWRWMTQRCDSPWYPTLRLFRQRQPQDWTGVVQDVNSALAESSCTYAGEYEH